MTDAEYPALYQAADRASVAAQRSYLRCIKAYAAFAILGAGISVYGLESAGAAFAAAVIFLAGLFVSIFMSVRKFESVWYRARAVAESIKTISWRFMMGAEPFHIGIAPQEVTHRFKERLLSILNEHKDLAADLASAHSASEQISPRMLEVRGRTLDERKEIYRAERIEEQRDWYSSKSQTNIRHGRYWFATLVSLQGGAIVLTLLRVAYPNLKFWPTEVFVVAALSALGWIQVKRFRELAAAYAVAAHEIGLALLDFPDIASEKTFANFVENTENAFSREHTQWVARKD
jgi:hypothetical protein